MDDLTAQRLVRRLTVTNAEMDAAFAGPLWSNDDPKAAADPDGVQPVDFEFAAGDGQVFIAVGP